MTGKVRIKTRRKPKLDLLRELSWFKEDGMLEELVIYQDGDCGSCTDFDVDRQTIEIRRYGSLF